MRIKRTKENIEKLRQILADYDYELDVSDDFTDVFIFNKDKKESIFNIEASGTKTSIVLMISTDSVYMRVDEAQHNLIILREMINIFSRIKNEIIDN